MVVAASPRSMAQVAAVLAFVISHTTFLAAQDDETGRGPKVCGWQVSLVSPAFPAWGRLTIQKYRFPHPTSAPSGHLLP